MSSRDEILQAVRAARPDPAHHPGAPGGGGEAPTAPGPAAVGDLAVSFGRALEEAGGAVLGLESATAHVGTGPGGDPGPDTDAVVALLDERFPGARIGSTVPGVAGHVDLASVADPRDLADLDVMVCRGTLGVAENGAVWLTESAMGHRAAPFLAQHMVVVLARDAIVADLHDAYRAIDMDTSGFALFVAGPSKTADIEQSLVMGAHGPRSLTLLLIDGEV